MYPTDLFGIIGLWVGLFLMLMVYSYPLYKENLFFRFAEHTFIGVTLAITVITAVQTTNRMAVSKIFQGQIIFVVPFVLGLLMFSTQTAKYRWLSRYPITVLIGSAMGLGMRGVLIPQILSQVTNTITPPVAGTALDWFNYVFVAVGTFCGILYFILSYEHTGVLKYPSKIGRYVLMLGLGGMFGNTVLARMTMLSGRAQFLLQVLKIIPM